MPNAWGNTTIVISDTHLGTDITTIKKSEDIDKFFENLETLILGRKGQIKDFVLLGDIFDIHLCDYGTSISKGYYFFNKIIEIAQRNGGCIYYIPGNHDHSFWLLHYFYNSCGDYLKQLRNQETIRENPFAPHQYVGVNSFFSGILRGRKVRFILRYPHFEIKDKGSNPLYFFTHGHFFDKEQRVLSNFIYTAVEEVLKCKRTTGLNIVFTAAKSARRLLSGEPVRPNVRHEAINALYNGIQYECLSLLSQTNMSRKVLEDVYQTLLNKDVGKPMEEYLNEIHNYLNDYLHSGINKSYGDAVRYVIFGHTHHAGINHQFLSKTNENAIVFNTGSWVIKDKAKNSMEGELVIIPAREQYPLLYSYKNGQLNLHPHMGKLSKGLIPRKSNDRYFF